MMLRAPMIYLTPASFVSRFWRVMRTALIALYEDNLLSIAKGVAYSSLLSFFPVLTTLATLLLLAKANEVARTISEFLYEVVPPGTEEVVRTLFIVHGGAPNILLIGGVLLSVWAASGAMISMMEGFRSIYRIPSGRSFVKERAMAIMLVFATSLPIVGA